MDTEAQTEHFATNIKPTGTRSSTKAGCDGYARDGFVVNDQDASESEASEPDSDNSEDDGDELVESGDEGEDDDSDAESGAKDNDGEEEESDPGALEDTDEDEDESSGVVTDAAMTAAVARTEQLLAECTSALCLSTDCLHLTCQHGADLPMGQGKVAIACQLRVWRILANDIDRTPHTELLRARVFAGLPERLRFRAAVNHPLGVLTIFASAGANETEVTAAFARIVREAGGFTWLVDNYEGKDMRVLRLLAAHDRVTELSLTAVINGAVSHRNEALLMAALARASANIHLRLTIPLVVIWELYANCWLAPLAEADRTLPFAPALDAMENTGGFVRRILAGGCGCRGALNDLLLKQLPEKQRQGMQPARGVCSFCKACIIRETARSEVPSAKSAARRKRPAVTTGSGDVKGSPPKVARVGIDA